MSHDVKLPITPGTKNASTSKSATDRAVSKTQAERERKRRMRAAVVVEHVDVIKNDFWTKRPWILAD